MSVTVVAGILISLCGICLSLSERAAGGDQQPGDKEQDATGRHRLIVSRAMIFASLTFVGLAILGLTHASVGESLNSPLFVSGMQGTLFYFGASLALSGTIGAVFAPTSRLVALSVAVLGTGSSVLLGLSGNVIAGALSLAGAAACGWWLLSPTHRPVTDSEADPSAVSRALSNHQCSTPEPLLTGIAVVLFCWILGAALQSSTSSEAGQTSGISGSARSLPRASHQAGSPGRDNSTDDGRQPRFIQTAMTVSSREDWLFYCAAGLLVATVGLGYSRSNVERSDGSAAKQSNAA